MISLDEFFIDALVAAGLWLRSGLVAIGFLFVAKLFPRFACRPLEAAFLASLLAMMQLAAFPPMRIQGDWRARDSGEPASILKSRELDQLAFGNCQHFAWPASQWEYVGYGEFKSDFVNDHYAASAFDRRLDAIDLTVEIGLLGVVMVLMHRHASPKSKKRRVAHS